MAKATKKKNSSGKEKGSVAKDKKKSNEQPGGLAGFTQFSKDSWSEFKKIKWPTFRQAVMESFVVIVTVIFIVGLVNLYDWIANFVFSFILQ